ncbi:MAG: flagellar protein FliS [Butyrivibrio sp.]|nr:flagellar protein FliS [Butyrivibrio sp.]
MTLEKKQEFTLKISQANKTQMITIIYEIVIDYLESAIKEIEDKREDDAQRSLVCAQKGIDELIHSVNTGYELGKNLLQIYIFSKKELTAAGACSSVRRIRKVLKNFQALCGAYRELEKYDNSGTVMGNAQKVYSGLTYGRNSMNVDFSSYASNRGFRA